MNAEILSYLFTSSSLIEASFSGFSFLSLIYIHCLVSMIDSPRFFPLTYYLDYPMIGPIA